MQRRTRWAAIGLSLAVLPFNPALARDKSTPTWPCVQRKIPTLTSTQVWEGPAVEAIKGWGAAPEIRTLVAKLADRRVPIEQAEADLTKYAESEPREMRSEHLTLVFAGAFETLHNLRKSVMSGLEHYLKAQQQRAAELEQQGEEIVRLKAKAAGDEKAGAELEAALERFRWAERIFQERQENLTFACEVPVRIDQRIFALGKAIGDLLKSGQDEVAAPDVTAPAPP